MRQPLLMLGTASVLALGTATSALAGTISGRVTDTSESVGLEGATIRVLETGQTASASRDGSFRITGLAAGRSTLRVSYVGADALEITVDLASVNDTISPTITLGDDVRYVENILVVGQRGAMNSALNRQRANDGLVTVLSSDAIGNFPDENVAEAARRAVGVNVLNDQDEGRFVSIRGADPNLVSTSINGVRLTSPEAEDRQVGLDVIDADVLSSVVINKSLLPNMDADSVGGNVEIETQSGLNVDGMTLHARVAGLYSEQEDEFGGRFSLNYADNFLDGRLGVAASYSYQERVFGSENLEVDGGWAEDGGIWFPKELEMRNYEVTRERTTAALNVDYRVNDALSFYSRTMFSDFSDQEYRSRVEVKFEYGDFDSGLSTANLPVFTSSEFGVDRDIKNRLETQRIFATDLGGEWLGSTTTVDWSLSNVYAEEEEEPNRLDTDFKAEFDSGETFAVDTTNPLRPELRFGNGADSQAFYDPANYELDEFEAVDGIAMDRELAAQINARHDFTLSGWSSYVQYGARVRNRDKKYNGTVGVFELDGLSRSLADFPNTVEYELENIGTTPDPFAVGDFFNAGGSHIERDDFKSQRDSLVEDYSFEEDVTAGYLMGSVENGPLRIVGGVRVERTDMAARGYRVLEAEEAASVGGVVLADDTLFIAETNTADDYTDVLPSVNLRYELDENLVFRGAYYASIQRPNPGQVAPRIFLEQDDNNDVEAEFGNPDLQRLEADNFDLALEWYPNNDSVVSIGYFYKDLENAIAGIQVENGTVNGIAFDEGSTYTNLSSGEIRGFEFNYQQELDFLHEGIIVGFNYTHADSDTTLPDGRSAPLPRQSDTVWNAILGYDSGPWDLRLAYSSRSEYLDEVRPQDDPTDPIEDRIVLDHAQLDFSGKYSITENFQLFGEVKNITDEPYVAVTRPDGIDRLEQFEQYGWSTVFGIRFTY